MARIRTIKPEFWQNETLANLPAVSRLLAIALLNHSDDHGYFIATHQIVRAACFPFDECSTNVRRGLDDLSIAGWIEVRKAPDGRLLGKVVNFRVHQKVDRPQKSKIAEIFEGIRPFDDHSTNARRTFDDRSLLDQGSGNRDQGKEEDLLASEINLEGNLSLASGAELKSSAAAEPACRTGGEVKQEPRSGRSVDEPETPAPPKALATPPVMVFPCRGAQSAWALSTEQVARWSEQYPGMDIAGECRKALAWLEASPTKQKTSQGMQRFLVNWLNRSADRPGLPQDSRSGVGTTPRTPVESFAAERQRLGRRSRLYLTLKTELKLPEFHARHLSAEFDQLLTEEEGVKAAIKALVERGLATFDGRVVTMTEQKPATDGIDHPPTQPQARITQEPERTKKGTERQGLVSLHELFTQPRKEKSA